LLDSNVLELASGLIATPTSPIAPDLESGDIKRKGTEVVMVFILSIPVVSCPLLF
jgi:hypothetical protein